MVTWAAKTACPRAECWAILMVQHWGKLSGHHWAAPLALAMVVKTAAERVVVWALEKVEKWDFYLAG